MEQLTEMFASILVHLNIKNFVGFGVGAGANILTRYALSNADNVWGLFLINPTAMSHAYYPRFRCGWYDLPSLQRGFFTDYLMGQLEWHWFGYGQAVENDVLHAYEELVHSLNPFNVAGYIQAFFARSGINLTRPPEPMPPNFFETHKDSIMTTPTLLVTGEKATDLARSLVEMNSNMDPKVTQFLLVPESNGMVMEENPEKLVMYFLSFLRSIDILVSMTPEKLHAEAVTEANLSEFSHSSYAPSSGRLLFDDQV